MTDQSPGGPRWSGLPRPLGDLRRSESDRWVAGVAGGIARHLGVESWIIRLITAALMMSGVGLAIYVLAWILVPSDRTPSVAEEKGWNRNTVIAVGVLVVIGSLWTFGPDDVDAPWRALPWLLVGLGIYLIVRADRRDRVPTSASATPVAAQSTPPPETPVGGSPPSPPPPAATASPPGPTPPTPPRPPRPRSLLTPLTLFALLALVGTAVLAGGTGWARPSVVAALSLCVIGAVLMLSALVGRARALIPVGFLVAVPLVVGVSAGDRWTEWGERNYQPASSSQIRARYEHGIGRTTLDLRDVDLPENRVTRVEIDQLIGQVVVWLPPDSTTQVRTEIGAGEVNFEEDDTFENDRFDFDEDSEDGFGRDVNRRIVSGTGTARLQLSVQIRFGEVVIVHGGTLANDTSTPSRTTPALPSTSTTSTTTSTIPTSGGTR